MALKDDVKGYFSDVKDALGKAGNATKTKIEQISNDGKTKIQIIQAENELSAATAELGKVVLNLIESGRDTISRFDETLLPQFQKIEGIKEKLKNLKSAEK